MIKNGEYCIDSYSDGTMDEDVYFVRPRHTNALKKKVDFSWGGTCIFLTDKGCRLSWKNRPLGCKMLEPKKRIFDNCVNHGGDKLRQARWWKRSNLYGILLDISKGRRGEV
ncbi:MAG: hypothetical protein WC365_08275 [Candidatus Babeliales bacterium]|jgi:hypothetical protein